MKGQRETLRWRQPERASETESELERESLYCNERQRDRDSDSGSLCQGSDLPRAAESLDTACDSLTVSDRRVVLGCILPGVLCLSSYAICLQVRPALDNGARVSSSIMPRASRSHLIWQMGKLGLNKILKIVILVIFAHFVMETYYY